MILLSERLRSFEPALKKELRKRKITFCHFKSYGYVHGKGEGYIEVGISKKNPKDDIKFKVEVEDEVL